MRAAEGNGAQAALLEARRWPTEPAAGDDELERRIDAAASQWAEKKPPLRSPQALLRLTLDEPIFCWKPSEAAPDFGKLSWTAAAIIGGRTNGKIKTPPRRPMTSTSEP